MAAGFRAKTRLCPVLETQYIQNPRDDDTTVTYLPGYRWRNPVCTFNFPTIPFTITVTYPAVPGYSVTFSGSALPQAVTTDPWVQFSNIANIESLYKLFGNAYPYPSGTFTGIQSVSTGVLYLPGMPIPAATASYVLVT